MSEPATPFSVSMTNSTKKKNWNDFVEWFPPWKNNFIENNNAGESNWRFRFFLNNFFYYKQENLQVYECDCVCVWSIKSLVRMYRIFTNSLFPSFCLSCPTTLYMRMSKSISVCFSKTIESIKGLKRYRIWICEILSINRSTVQ